LALLFVLFLGLCSSAAPAGDDPFTPKVTLTPSGQDEALLRIAFPVPPGYDLYADSVEVKASGNVELTPQDIPKGSRKKDPFSDKEREVHETDFTVAYRLRVKSGDTLNLSVSYQGCTAELCYPPTTQDFTLSLKDIVRSPSAAVPTPTPKPGPTSRPGPTPKPAPAPVGAASPQTGPAQPPEDEGLRIARTFQVAGMQGGFLPPNRFLAFLDAATSASGKGADGPLLESGTDTGGAGFLAEHLGKAGIALALLLALGGGLLLNLTPCVLPMIPINLAVIGAGARAGSRARGFALGAAYGAGIAVTYGVLGLLAALAGARFGTLNSNPWFNFAIAAVFVALALAAFGAFNLDLTRLRSGKPRAGGPRAGNFAAAGFMGVVAALLAGACVAPVVLAALTAAVKFHSAGQWAGLLLPFMLGAGMALPWPVAGAGLSFLPKPGRWMIWVKNGFGVFILLMAVYYGQTGYSALTRKPADGGFPVEPLQRAKAEGKMVLVDFWATWCKNCKQMDRVTFSDAGVRKRLGDFVVVKVQAEDFRDPRTKAILEQFHVRGLPSYVVLQP
jgi:thiol:disulfide interchange protein